MGQKYIQVDDKNMVIAVFDEDLDDIPPNSLPIAVSESDKLAADFTAIRRYKYDVQTQELNRQYFTVKLTADDRVDVVYDQANGNSPLDAVPITDAEFKLMRGQSHLFMIKDGQLIKDAVLERAIDRNSLKERVTAKADDLVVSVISKNRIAERMLDMFEIVQKQVNGESLSVGEAARVAKYRQAAIQARQARVALNKQLQEIDSEGVASTELPPVDVLS